MRRCIKEPIPEIFAVWEAMTAAVDEHFLGNSNRAAELFEKANSFVVWNWLNSAWVNVINNVVEHRPNGDSRVVPRVERDPDRNIATNIRAAVLKRDGYRCRYCGIPVVHADIRKIAAKLYPSSVRWDGRDPTKQHAGFQCLWLQFDHVQPHSHGGRSNTENVVISCALCNFGKDRFTLRQLHLEDPRLRDPEPTDYDGLERLRMAAPMMQGRTMIAKPAGSQPKVDSDRQNSQFSRYFLPGAVINSGYLNTLPIDGKKRWFKLNHEVQAEPTVRDGIEGCLLTCRRKELTKRGINEDALIDYDQLNRK